MNPHQFHNGFTLLELLLVLLIVALLAAVAAPALWRGLDGARERAAREQVTLWLAAQPRTALLTGRPRTPNPANDLRLPAGLRLTFDPLPRYDHRGLSSGGLARLTRDDGRLLAAWRILAPTGAVQPLSQGAATGP